MTADEVREAAIENTKRGGDRWAAIALALVYVGDRIGSEVADALRTIGVKIGSRN